MLKTCFNCKYYHTIKDVENDAAHWHNFCSKWKTILSGWNYYNDDVELSLIYDDFETGRAGCYMFEETDEQFFSDEWMLENRKNNDYIIDGDDYEN